MSEIRERPILFSAPMVRAILDGQKTMTRRVVKLPSAPAHLGNWEPTTIGDNGVYDSDGNPAPEEAAIWHTRTGQTLLCPCGKPSDRLWVRETFQPLFADGMEFAHVDYKTGEGYRASYPATDGIVEFIDADDDISMKCMPSIHMPRWASRILLEITNIRVERLQDITDDDTWAEGIEAADGALDEVAICAMAKKIGCCIEDARPTFAALWNSINAQRGYGWDANPFVWVVEFRRIAT